MAIKKRGCRREVKLRQKRRVSERRIDTLWFVTDSATLYYERKHGRCAPSLSQDGEPVRERWLLRSGRVCIYYCSVTMCYKLRRLRNILCLQKQRKWSSFANFLQPPVEVPFGALPVWFFLHFFLGFFHCCSINVSISQLTRNHDGISP